ncbi:MAG TPA: hypothetical protein VKI45_03695 [Allosphingosinicella sp.]|nr:hypothetical protein [Allosphingosinicella sp.]
MIKVRSVRIAAATALGIASLVGPMAAPVLAQDLTELRQCLRGCNEAYWNNQQLHTECVARCADDYG